MHGRMGELVTSCSCSRTTAERAVQTKYPAPERALWGTSHVLPPVHVPGLSSAVAPAERPLPLPSRVSH
jgi:hypothetical protein